MGLFFLLVIAIEDFIIPTAIKEVESFQGLSDTIGNDRTAFERNGSQVFLQVIARPRTMGRSANLTASRRYPVDMSRGDTVVRAGQCGVWQMLFRFAIAFGRYAVLVCKPLVPPFMKRASSTSVSSADRLGCGALMERRMWAPLQGVWHP